MGYGKFYLASGNGSPEELFDVTNTTAQQSYVLESINGTAIKFYDNKGNLVQGTMKWRGNQGTTLYIGKESQVLSEGYHDGTGVISISLQEKTVTPTTSEQSIIPDDKQVLSKVVIKAIKTQTTEVTPSASTQTITGNDTEGYYSKVTIRSIEGLAGTDAIAENLLAGKKAVVKDSSGHAKQIVGTMTNWGDQSTTLYIGKESQKLSEGYHNGTGVIKIVPQDEITVTPTTSEQSITAESGKVLSAVKVNPIPTKYQDTTNLNASSKQVLAGQKFIGAGKVESVGTMKNVGEQFASLSPEYPEHQIMEGYHSGNGKISVKTQQLTMIPSANTQVKEADSNGYYSKVTIQPVPGIEDTNAIAENLLVGTKAVTKNSDGSVSQIEGTMVDNGKIDETLTTSATSYTIPKGYHNGTGVVSIITQRKESSAGYSNITIKPDSGCVLSSVTIKAIPTYNGKLSIKVR